MLYLLFLAIGLVIGGVAGFVIAAILIHRPDDTPVGNLIFDQAVSESIPYLALKNESDLGLIGTKKYITLQVKHIKAKSQK
jgi:hypothetical protein